MTATDAAPAGLDLRAPANRVSPRAKVYWTLRALMTWIVLGSAEWLILYVGGSPLPSGRWLG